MRKVTYIMIFPDGEKLVAKACAKAPGDTVSIEYSGTAVKPAPFPEQATLGFLEWYWQVKASSAGADMEVTVEGDYESGAGG
jgi:hypothetical protein